MAAGHRASHGEADVGRNASKNPWGETNSYESSSAGRLVKKVLDNDRVAYYG